MRYKAYLLRMWREGGAAWRVCLEDPHTGQRLAFAGVDQLAGYLAEAAQADFAAGAAACPPRLEPIDPITETPNWERSDDG